ncbi:hypothetical protein L228DRAFT_236427 [Xylona heveae TC161]|uniref:Uncharacterized protein n=1 Tax=Xylona heveae (strain CBS 132557 / TC161) TaxID=1328760 RepID=A0A165ISB7_XYLHT|nr:hypothetical protein L228DRAFT_236427 [Xylona heveae TC161]KZF25314.1 hypothetical protein L228DRAFT_236427 [Xylona heveae TC161]
MVGFNYLLPALIFNLKIWNTNIIGPLEEGVTAFNGQSRGTVTSVHGYNTTVNGTVIHMDDFFSLYPDNKTYAISPRGLFVTEDGVKIGVEASGYFDNIPHVQAIFNKEPGVNGTDFGEIPSGSVWTFKTGHPKYKDLGESMFVGNFRLFPGDADNSSFFNVEYRLAKILPGPPCK